MTELNFCEFWLEMLNALICVVVGICMLEHGCQLIDATVVFVGLITTSALTYFLGMPIIKRRRLRLLINEFDEAMKEYLRIK